MNKSCISGWCLLFLLTTSVVSAQSSADLKKRRSALSKQISVTNQLLSDTRNNQRVSQTELILLNKQISLQEQKISNLGYQISSLDGQIAEKLSIIEAAEADLENLKGEYARMIGNAWKNKSSNDKMLFIFASESLDQAYQRMKYMQSYVAERERLKQEILNLKKTMANDVVDLEGKKAERQDLLGLQRQDKDALASTKSQQESAYQKLINSEQRLRAQLRAQERDKEKLNSAIASAIRKEIEREKNRNSGTFKLTPEAKLVSSKFEKNKGKLPWPVERGVITSSFGEHPHPTIPGLKIDNNGIDIATTKRSEVRAVFEGEVISVILISGAGKTVMIRHGGYYTAYSNLSEVSVKKGDQVSIKEKIGVLLEDPNNGGKSISHFEIWRISSSGGMDKINPALWIYNR